MIWVSMGAQCGRNNGNKLNCSMSNRLKQRDYVVKSCIVLNRFWIFHDGFCSIIKKASVNSLVSFLVNPLAISWTSSIVTGL